MASIRNNKTMVIGATCCQNCASLLIRKLALNLHNASDGGKLRKPTFLLSSYNPLTGTIFLIIKGENGKKQDPKIVEMAKDAALVFHDSITLN